MTAPGTDGIAQTIGTVLHAAHVVASSLGHESFSTTVVARAEMYWPA